MHGNLAYYSRGSYGRLSDVCYWWAQAGTTPTSARSMAQCEQAYIKTGIIPKGVIRAMVSTLSIEGRKFMICPLD